MTVDEALSRLQKSDFRARFHLSDEDISYIDKKGFVKKWVLTIVGYPLIGAVLSGIMMLFMK